MASIRYFVNDIGESIAFYTQWLGFTLENNFGPFAIVYKDDLRLWLSDPRTSAHLDPLRTSETTLVSIRKLTAQPSARCRGRVRGRCLRVAPPQARP